jgi:hypothetical protein
MKIIDFGLSRVDDEVEHMSTKVSLVQAAAAADYFLTFTPLCSMSFVCL